MKQEYFQLTGIQLGDSFEDLQKLHRYKKIRERYTFKQLMDMRMAVNDVIKMKKSNYQYKIADMNESVIVAHIKQINKKNGFPSYERQFKKQAKSIIDKHELGVIRWALHKAENMKLENEISFTFVERVIEQNELR